MISGTTRVISVVADPVFQLRTPQALNAVWEKQGADLVTVPAHVAAGHLGTYLAGLRVDQSIAGAVISVPHKTNASALCDRLEHNARIVGVVNTIRRESDGSLTGETFDGLGFVAGLTAEGIQPTGYRVVLLGAGGAAASVAAALIGAGIDRLEIVNRTPRRAEELRARLTEQTGFSAISTTDRDLGGADLIVNATSNGMSPGDTPHVDLTGSSPSAVLAEVIVSAEPTPLMAAAAARGLRVHGGRHMLEGQLQLIAKYMAS